MKNHTNTIKLAVDALFEARHKNKNEQSEHLRSTALEGLLNILKENDSTECGKEPSVETTPSYTLMQPQYGKVTMHHLLK